MPDSIPPYSENYDLSNCDAEPVHLIRHFQRAAFLLVVETKGLGVVAHSGNLPLSAGDMGEPLDLLLDSETMTTIRNALATGDPGALNPLHVNLKLKDALNASGWNLIISQSNDFYLLEFEPRDEEISTSGFLSKVDFALQRVQAGGHKSELFNLVTASVRELTGYDRVMLYRFDPDYNGEVVAETKTDDLTPFLHLRYPHTDIPSQARELFLRNNIRHIVSTEPDSVSGIVFSPGLHKLDLSLSANRGSSPIHLEYLRNMEVGASLVVAIIVNHKLWGLISCHHNTPKLVDYRLRQMISLVGKILSGHLALNQATVYREQIKKSRVIRSHLFERMNSDYDIVAGLMEDPDKGLLRMAGASGAALLFDGRFFTLGQCPNEEELRVVVSWLGEMEQNLFATNKLFEQLPEAAGFSCPSPGLMAVRLSHYPGEYILWFRPETVETIQWGGRPDQRKHLEGGRVQLHPNLSFQKWEQEQAGMAEAWEDYHKDAATSLRNDIKEVVLRKYQALRKLNGQLVDAYEEMESFSYTVSHDLKAPLRHIKGFAEILQEDYYDDMPEDGKLAIDTILSSVGRMNTFINDMLSFSRLGRTEPTPERLDLAELTREVWEELTKFHERDFEFTADINQAVLIGDRRQLKQLVQNLLSNTVKYTRDDVVPSVSVKGGIEGNEVFYVVTDNGIGLDMKHAEWIFDVFNRLVAEDRYEGTGVGLAIVKRVLEKHGGRISLLSTLGQGTTFTVYLPTNHLAKGEN